MADVRVSAHPSACRLTENDGMTEDQQVLHFVECCQSVGGQRPPRVCYQGSCKIASFLFKPHHRPWMAFVDLEMAYSAGVAVGCLRVSFGPVRAISSSTQRL